MLVDAESDAVAVSEGDAESERETLAVLDTLLLAVRLEVRVPVCDMLVDSVADAVSVALDVTELDTLCAGGKGGGGGGGVGRAAQVALGRLCVVDDCLGVGMRP
jgi:hypothetical protein